MLTIRVLVRVSRLRRLVLFWGVGCAGWSLVRSFQVFMLVTMAFVLCSTDAAYSCKADCLGCDAHAFLMAFIICATYSCAPTFNDALIKYFAELSPIKCPQLLLVKVHAEEASPTRQVLTQLIAQPTEQG